MLSDLDLVVSDSLPPHGPLPIRLLCPWNSPGKNTGVGCHFLLQGIFPAQGSNPGLPHCRQTLYSLSHQVFFTNWEGAPKWDFLTHFFWGKKVHTNKQWKLILFFFLRRLTQWTWVWVNSGSWWWTGKPGVLQFMGSQRVGHDWATELNWTSTSIKRKLSITLKKNFTATLSVERSHPNPECSVYLHQFKVSIQYQGQHTLPL